MSKKTSDQNIQFLSGGGEMGELIRKKDWSKTLVGDPADWPQSLRTALGIILNSKFPMFLWWGPELICFYNDAYRPSLGQNGKHPSILGMKAEEAWVEIWEIIKPLIDQVLAGGESTWSEDQLIPIFRNGKIEDVYWTFSYSPVNDESGKPAGILVTCTETTGKVNTFKKIEESEKRFRDTVEQAPLGIAIFRGPEFIVEMANDTYLQIVYRKESDVVGKPLFEVLPEVKTAVEPLLTGVLTSGIPFHGTEFPAMINQYGKQELHYFNFVYQPLREDNGDISGIIVVATDVTESVKGKFSLAESEKQFRHLVMQSPIPMAIFRGKEYIIEMANVTMFKNIWRKKEEQIVGKKVLEVFPELKEQKYPELLDKVFSTGISHSEKESLAYVQGNDGLKKFYFDYEYSPLFDPNATVSGIMITVNDVTEKVESRKKIEESEKRFRNVADSAPVLIWMADTDMFCHFFNKAWLNFTGRTMEQESGRGWTEGIHPDDAQRCAGTYAGAFEKREEFYMEYRLRRHDGEYRWISDNGVPRFTGDGIFEGYIGACMDIDERVIYRTRLKEDEERLNIVVDASDLATWELKLQASGIFYSERYLEILGHERGTVLTHEQILAHLHPDDLPIRKKAFQEAYATGLLYYTSRIIWNDGSIHWIENRGKVFYDEVNKPLKMIGTTRDITDEKKYQQQLQDREEKFRMLADSMPQFVWTGDVEGNLNYFNQSVYNYSGLTPAQIEREGWIQIVHPDDREENIKRWMQSIETGEDFIFEHRFRRHDGVYRWQLSRAMAQRDDAGEIQMWVGTSTDIQDQKMFTRELEKQVLERTRQLEQKNKELEKMNSELQSFAYVSSHDLQEPLRKIQTFASRLLEKEKDNLSEHAKDYFGRMQEAANRMQTLIEDLLAYSRTNSTERVFKKTALNEIITEVKNELREIMTEKNAVIESGQLCEIDIIPFQFRQLLNNLIGNSIKFSKPEVPPHIKISSETIKGDTLKIAGLSAKKMYCHLTISDNGIGFDPEYNERIFEIFQRLHGRDEYKGTGIGLAIVKKIVENHNGIITALGEPGKGATFDIYIPV